MPSLAGRGMHIDAICAAIYLRNPQIHEIDASFWKAGFLKIDSSERLETFRGSLGVVDAIAHDDESFCCLLKDSMCCILATV
jgi:hypothetical protein